MKVWMTKYRNMQNRRDFLKTAALAALGTGLMSTSLLAEEKGKTPLFNINRGGTGGKLKLRFFPYELKLRHVFTVATYSRTTTPDVQVEVEYEGITGYGEASMPPYLGQTVETVTAFLSKVKTSLPTWTASHREIRLQKRRWTLPCTTWWESCCRHLGTKYGG